MLFYLSYGITLGLASGFSPGPLLTLVISETVNHGRKEGLKVAIAPLITDLPIILLCFLVLYYIKDNNLVFGILSLAGGIFLAYISRYNFSIGEFRQNEKVDITSMQKGIIANFLNPAPYIFWLTIGATTIFKGWSESFIFPVVFIVSFYICLIGSKVIIAILVSRSMRFIRSGVFRWINFFLGILILFIAVKFVYDGYLYIWKAINP